MKNIYRSISIPLALILGIAFTAAVLTMIRSAGTASAAGTTYYINANTPEGSRSFARRASNNSARFAANPLNLSTPVTFTLDITASSFLTGVSLSSAAWGDYDNDGDLDILLAGWDGNSRVASVFKNTGSGFTEDLVASSALPNAYDGSAAWGDYDNDGDLDILLTGSASGGVLASVYENTGSGFAEDLAASSVLTGVANSSAAWGDYDNDGDLDILLTGNPGPLSSVFENTGTGFTEDLPASSILPGVYYSSAAWGDYDNDGDLDILLTGHTGISPLSSLFENTGTGFTEDLTASSVLTGVNQGSAAWGDYDNDGDLDILLTGSTSSGPLSSVYENTGSGFTEDLAASSALTGTSLGSAAWGDYDNDGDLDILLTGYDGSSRMSSVYENTGLGFTEDITASSVLTGVNSSSAVWGDYDNDGDLDILLTGYDGSSLVANVYRNNTATANTPPSAPTGLNSGTFGSQQINLSWSPPAPLTYTTPYSGLSYNLRVGSNPGLSDALAPMSCIGTCGISGDGYRQIPVMGTANYGLTASLSNLALGTYYWSVQAVDHTFAGSPWADEGSFSILAKYELSVSLNGTGSGIVTSDPAGITCGADCSESYLDGSLVTLTHTADFGSTFSGWGGACTGSGECVVTMDDAKNVTASFEKGLLTNLPIIYK